MSEQTVQLPFRPRLADHVCVRRHEVDGAIQAQLFDRDSGMVYDLTDEELEQVLCMDGTRDFGGLVLAIVRSGSFRRTSEVQQLLGQMQAAGLLVDGIAPPSQEPVRHPSRPLAPMPGYHFTCHGAGTCCTTFSSVPFSETEALRAAGVAPERIEKRVDRAFLPLWGVADRSMSVVTMRDGRCPFLDEDQRCVVHERAGASAKPLGCRIFPNTYVDDGEAVRVSVKAECPCVFESLTATDGAPLIAPAVKVEGDLDRRTHVVRLPDRVAVGHGRSASRSEIHAWSAALVGADIRDGVAAGWQLAADLEAHGLDPDGSGASLGAAVAPSPDDLRAHLVALAEVAKQRRGASEGRLPDDRIRLLSVWCDEACQALLDDANVLRRLSEVPEPARESFYLRAAIWGHGLVTGGASLAAALRDRAVRLLLARQMPFSTTTEAARDPSAGHPIAAMEAMMRGRALERYADNVG